MKPEVVKMFVFGDIIEKKDFKMSHFAILEDKEGKREEVNGVIDYRTDGNFFYMVGVDFEMWFSVSHYKFIEIREGNL